jgi:ribonuclease P protein component
MTREDLRVDQTHVPAEQSRAQAPARLPFADGDEERPQGALPPAFSRPQAAVRVSISRLKTRQSFLDARKGRKAARPLVVIEARRRDDNEAVRAGFTATKRIGNAVARNRAKRRLRAAAEALLGDLAAPGCDYVFIARQATGEAPWERLLDDVRSALLRLAPALAPVLAEPPAAPTPSEQNGPI